MSTKEEVFEYLNNHKSEYVSGSVIASELGVSRNAIWKAINNLKKDGLVIEAISNKGYRILEESDILSSANVLRFLDNPEELRIEVFDLVTSTNTIVKEKGSAGEKEGLVIIAKEQSAGKGRMNRSFKSPKGSGVYFSLLLRPKMKPSEALFITTIAAVAVADAIEKITGKETHIKWVNDIYVGKRKVCGILTEGSISMENGYLDMAIPGIGINIREPEGGWPEEIKSIAGSILKEDEVIEDVTSKLVAYTLNTFMKYYKTLPDKLFLEEYKKRSIVIDKDVYVIDGNHGNLGTTDEIVKMYKNELKVAHVIDIDDELGLVVKYEDGSTDVLRSGEVSVREK